MTSFSQPLHQKTPDQEIRLLKLQSFITDICLLLKIQNTNYAKKNLSHLRYLNLADKSCLKSTDIDILIATDSYWHSMKSRIIRGHADKSATF